MNEETRRRASERQKGRNNSNWVERLTVNLNDDEERQKAFSYLVGYWIGDGLRTILPLGFSVRDDKEYIQNLVEKTSLILGSTVKWRYEKNSYCLFFYSETELLKERIIKELNDKTLIRKWAWYFITGFLDSDGWISYWSTKGNDKRNINICFVNTNMNFLLLVQEILDYVLVPYSLSLGTNHLQKNCKPCWTLQISTNAGTYLVAHKILPITIDKKKKERCKEFINFFDETHNNQTIPICEIFTSIQGEGSNVGRLQLFIRAATCDMHCKICDSKYTWKKYQRRKKLSQIVKEVIDSKAQSVCLTGGEITQFRNSLIGLIGMLRVHDLNIVLQTNGLHWYRGFELIHTVSMDMKTPCTGEKSNEDLILKLKEKDEIKTLISDMKDYEYSIRLNKLTNKLGIRHILQPLNLVGQDDTDSLLNKYKWLCEMVVKDKRWGENVRVIPQMHVLLWGNKRKR
jgi:7-carboxy-7-deazaguanine synthase